MRIIAASSIFFLLLATGNATSSRAQGEESAKVFVQKFYKWYTSHLADTGSNDPSELTVKKRRQDLSPTLYRALLEDEQASAKSKDGIVGLDFDPFVNSQDPDTTYWTGKASHKGKIYFVTVFGKSKDRPTTLATTVKLEMVNGRWQFQNLLYPNGPDLLEVLRSLKKERAKYPAQ